MMRVRDARRRSLDTCASNQTGPDDREKRVLRTGPRRAAACRRQSEKASDRRLCVSVGAQRADLRTADGADGSRDVRGKRTCSTYGCRVVTAGRRLGRVSAPAWVDDQGLRGVSKAPARPRGEPECIARACGGWTHSAHRQPEVGIPMMSGQAITLSRSLQKPRHAIPRSFTTSTCRGTSAAAAWGRNTTGPARMMSARGVRRRGRVASGHAARTGRSCNAASTLCRRRFAIVPPRFHGVRAFSRMLQPCN
jgi:hypothetical protein